MLFNYFAGAIFTTQEAVIFLLIAFAIIGTIVGVILFIGNKLVDKVYKKGTSSKSSLVKAILVGFGLLATIILLFIVLPTMVKDSNWSIKEKTCAKEAGYQSPSDDNSDVATAESQVAYRKCLGL